MAAQQPDLGLRGDLDAAQPQTLTPEELSRRKAEADFEQQQQAQPPAQQQPPSGRSSKSRSVSSDAEALTRAIEETDKVMVEFKPFGSDKVLRLTGREVRKSIANPTKSGKQPGADDIYFFLKWCESMALNPWAGDAFLVGYDTQQGPKFSRITSHLAMSKRAERSPHYNGKESGIVVILKGENTVTNVVGSILPPGATLVGGWCRLYRKDREYPELQTTSLKAYARYGDQWAKDPEWMITKCAEMKALRGAFPTELSGMYSREEIDGAEPVNTGSTIRQPSRVSELPGEECDE